MAQQPSWKNVPIPDFSSVNQASANAANILNNLVASFKKDEATALAKLKYEEDLRQNQYKENMDSASAMALLQSSQFTDPSALRTAIGNRSLMPNGYSLEDVSLDAAKALTGRFSEITSENQKEYDLFQDREERENAIAAAALANEGLSATHPLQLRQLMANKRGVVDSRVIQQAIDLSMKMGNPNAFTSILSNVMQDVPGSAFFKYGPNAKSATSSSTGSDNTSNIGVTPAPTLLNQSVKFPTIVNLLDDASLTEAERKILLKLPDQYDKTTGKITASPYADGIGSADFVSNPNTRTDYRNPQLGKDESGQDKRQTATGILQITQDTIRHIVQTHPNIAQMSWYNANTQLLAGTYLIEDAKKLPKGEAFASIKARWASVTEDDFNKLTTPELLYKIAKVETGSVGAGLVAKAFNLDKDGKQATSINVNAAVKSATSGSKETIARMEQNIALASAELNVLGIGEPNKIIADNTADTVVAQQLVGEKGGIKGMNAEQTLDVLQSISKAYVEKYGGTPPPPALIGKVLERSVSKDGLFSNAEIGSGEIVKYLFSWIQVESGDTYDVQKQKALETLNFYMSGKADIAYKSLEMSKNNLEKLKANPEKLNMPAAALNDSQLFKQHIPNADISAFQQLFDNALGSVEATTNTVAADPKAQVSIPNLVVNSPKETPSLIATEAQVKAVPLKLPNTGLIDKRASPVANSILAIADTATNANLPAALAELPSLPISEQHTVIQTLMSRTVDESRIDMLLKMEAAIDASPSKLLQQSQFSSAANLLSTRLKSTAPKNILNVFKQLSKGVSIQEQLSIAATNRHYFKGTVNDEQYKQVDAFIAEQQAKAVQQSKPPMTSREQALTNSLSFIDNEADYHQFYKDQLTSLSPLSRLPILNAAKARIKNPTVLAQVDKDIKTNNSYLTTGNKVFNSTQSTLLKNVTTGPVAEMVNRWDKYTVGATTSDQLTVLKQLIADTKDLTSLEQVKKIYNKVAATAAIKSKPITQGTVTSSGSFTPEDGNKKYEGVPIENWVKLADVPASVSEQAVTYAVDLEQKMDGDTLTGLIDGKETTCRIYGVDAPETAHPEYGKLGQYFGKNAGSILKSLLSQGQISVQVLKPAEEGKNYNRAVCRILVSGKDVSPQLLAMGAADLLNYANELEPTDLARLSEAEKLAKSAGLGIHANPNKKSSKEHRDTWPKGNKTYTRAEQKALIENALKGEKDPAQIKVLNETLEEYK